MTALSVLRELVELKAMQDRYEAECPKVSARCDRVRWAELEALNAEYLRRKPIVWAKARALLMGELA